MKLSMGSWSFAFGPYSADPKSLDQIAERLSAAGYDGIELSGWPPHVTLERYSTPQARAALRRRLGDLGLGVSGFSADLGPGNPTVEGQRQCYIDEFRRVVELCAELGSPSIRVDTVAAPGSIPQADYQPAMRRLADTWRECANHARQAGIVMVWEFEPGFVFNKPGEVLALHRMVGHPFFQILFDTAHAYTCSVTGARQPEPRELLEGGPALLLDQLDEAIGAIHMVDTDGSLYLDETSTHLLPGRGHIQWDQLAPRLLALPHIGWWCLDLCFCAQAWDLIDENLRLAREIIDRAAAQR